MPSAAARRLYEDQIPTFMSVFDLDAEGMDDRDAVTVVDPKLVGIEAPKISADSLTRFRPSTLPSESAHKHHDSTSTQNSESAESSPTTTLSCTDSSSLSDPSPASSPDSPVNLQPLSSRNTALFGGLSSMGTLTFSESMNAEKLSISPPPPRRPRNMKGLSIQASFNSLSSNLVSEPSSPSFIKPKIPAMKRKPSQLSLKTNSSDLVSRSTLETPISPSVPPILQRRALKHSTSSPHMLSSLKSATFGPAGGMTIPTVLERNESGLSEFLRPSRPAAPTGFDSTILEEDSPIRTQIANRAAFEFEPYRDHETNEDHKSPGYPDGPIAIYDDNVFLYLEPTAEEASRFDVVINVAREVNNPFKVLAQVKSQVPLDGRQADDSPIPDTAVTTASYTTAYEFLPDEDSPETPTTPKAQVPLKEPEYIHMPWDHNTDISQDLIALCQTIEKKTREGKRVLVHCQQGASRSASLIIAYGVWQNPELSVNDAYYAAQSKSRWISPNMKLMYCLQDFQKEVARRKLGFGIGSKTRTGRSPTKHRSTLSADAIDISKKEPLSAPLPNEDAASKESGLDKIPVRNRGNSTPNRGEPISPGPSSAPSSFSWSEKEDVKDPGKFGRFNLDSIVKQSHSDSISALQAKPLPPLEHAMLSAPEPHPSQLGTTFRFSSIRHPPPPPMSLAPLPIASALPTEQDHDSSPFRSDPEPPLPPIVDQSPPSLLKPSPSPSFIPMGSSFRPPPSPGFASHRFGGQLGGFGLGPLSLGVPRRQDTREAAPERRVKVMRSFPGDSALMSPRAETMTNNPLREPAFAGDFAGMQFAEAPPTPGESLFSPRESLFPPRDPFVPFGRPTQTADPRSPPTKGEMPIVRSIDELL